jgi:uncharacterized membrane protein
MQNPPPVQTTKSSTGLDDNIAALLSYIFGWVSGLIFFIMEKDSRLVRFHAMQSILLNAAALVVGIALWIAWAVVAIVGAMISESLGALFGFLFGLLIFLFYIALFVGVILCLVKAYQRQYFKLPVIGNFAEKFSTK